MMFRSILAGAMALGLAAACTTTDQYGNVTQNRTGTGVLAGAAAGALLGTLAGGDDRRNALIGAGVGALAGGAVGNYMDRQEREFRERLRESGVTVRRVGNELVLIMPGNLTFPTDSAQIQPRFGPVLNDVADVLQTYPATYVDIIGHTDSVGSAEYNQTLSERRASSVASALIQRGVLSDRLYVAGMGETMPIASNETDEGRAANRRVEIRIAPHTQS
ncbi:OmpA family protein [Marinicauda algicola]|uniref:OmpA family protein n=2 Tax=Marinicauda algicola TaxID=2029849 RepID=A0A4S2H3N8_9PROT|nr:OmpA family protein [Marinicauda algicola]TGY89882.1 OmpA family protein [Marinicauda algicola]